MAASQSLYAVYTGTKALHRPDARAPPRSGAATKSHRMARSARRRSSRGALNVQEDSDCQSRRDRLPGRGDRAADGHPHRRRVFRCRRRREARAGLRRGGAHRPGGAEGELPARRPHPRGRAADRRRGGPSGLRLPERERRLRRSVRGGRHRLRRAAAVGDQGDGAEVRIEAPDGRGRRAAGAGLSRRRPGPGAAAARGRPDRLSGADQGERGRRREGHADGRRVGGVRAGARVVPARGEEQLRRRRGADRALRDPAAPHRDPGLRRCARPLPLPVRARLLGAAPPPEGARGGAGAGHERGAPARDGRGRGRRGARGRLCRRRHGRVHRRAGRRRQRRPALLLHGDEHPAPGRAPGDRGDHRPRPGRMAVARRGRRSAAADPGRARDRRPCDRGPHLGREPRRRLPAGDRPARGLPAAAGDRVRARQPTRRCASTAACARATRSRRTTTR